MSWTLVIGVVAVLVGIVAVSLAISALADRSNR